MNNQDAIDSLALQHQRFTDMMRSIDGGIWWSPQSSASLNIEGIKDQAAVIGGALDALTFLMKKVAA